MDEEVLPLVIESDCDDDVVETRLDVRLEDAWPRTAVAIAAAGAVVPEGDEDDACCVEGVSDVDDDEEVDTVDSAN